MKRHLLAGTLVMTMAVMTSSSVLAIHDSSEQSEPRKPSESTQIRDRIESRTDDTAKVVVQTTEDSKNRVSDSLESREKRLEQLNAERQERFEKRAAQRASRLEGRRLAQCQNRQENINALMTRSVETGTRHYENIKRIEDKVLAFAEKKALDEQTYAAALQDAQDKGVNAKSAVEVASTQKFDCTKVDGEKPSDLIRLTHSEKRDALNAYRASVVELIQTVKAAFASTQTDTPDTENGEVTQ